MTFRLVNWILLCSLSILAVTGGQVTTHAASRVFNLGEFDETPSIDPHVGASRAFTSVENAYESLLYTDRDTLNLKPVLAESWTSSSDGRSYTFKIRRGVKFHDGATLDAEAVKINFERLRKINRGPVWALASVESVTVEDPHTLRVTVKPGGVPFLQGLIRVLIVSPKAIREQERGGDLAQGYLNRQSAGTGPYKIVSWQRSQKIALQKFEEYWGGWKDPNHFTDVNLLFIPEAATQRLMLEKGDIDAAFKFPVEALPAMERNPNLRVVRSPGLRVFYFLFQYSAPPTGDVRVRQAINYAFDSSAFITAMGNTYDPSIGPVPKIFLGDWSPNFPYKFDVKKAGALLREAGYSEAKKARLILDIVATIPDQKKAAEILQAGLNATDVAELDIRPGDFNVNYRYNVGWQRTKDPATAHHLFALFTPARVPDPFAYLWYIFHSDAAGGAANNIMSYFNPKFDELMDAAAYLTDPLRTRVYRQATQLLIDDAAAMYIGTQKQTYVLRADVRGFFSHPTYYPHILFQHLSRR